VISVSVSLKPQGWNRSVLAVEDGARKGFRDSSHAFAVYTGSAKKTVLS
jgi:hypothetical protein